MKDRRPPSGSLFSGCPALPRFSAEGHKNRQTRTAERTVTGRIRMAGRRKVTWGKCEEGKMNREGR